MAGRLVLAGSSPEADPRTRLFSIQLPGLSHSMMTRFKSKCSERQEVEAINTLRPGPRNQYRVTSTTLYWPKQSQSLPRLKEKTHGPHLHTEGSILATFSYFEIGYLRTERVYLPQTRVYIHTHTSISTMYGISHPEFGNKSWALLTKSEALEKNVHCLPV